MSEAKEFHVAMLLTVMQVEDFSCHATNSIRALCG